MRIRTKLKIAAWVPAFVACIVGIALFFSLQMDNEGHEKLRMVRHVINRMHELNNLARSYMLHHPEHAKQQFVLEQDALDEFITHSRFPNAEQQQHLDDIGQTLAAMRDIFDQLVFNYERPAAPGDPRLHDEVDKRLSGQILIHSREGVAQALQLENLIAEEIFANQRTLYGLILILIASTTFALTFILLRMMKNTAASLSALQEGTRIIAAGDLNHRIGLAARDEIGELSGAFDRMTGQLQETTVSRNELIEENRQRKNAEEALRRQKEWFRVLITSIGDAVIATDTSGHIIFINPVAVDLTGWPMEEALGRPIQEVFRIINEKTRRPAEDIIGRVLVSGNIVNLANHTALVARHGREIPIEDSAAPIKDDEGKLIGVVLVFHDVTEKRRAQEALAESADKLRIVSDFTYDWEYWRSPDNQFLYVSPSCERVTGYTREEFLRDPNLYADIIHPDDRTRVLEHLHEDRNHDDLCEFEFRIFHRDGSQRWLAHACRPVLNANGQPIGRRSSDRDITERKKAEEALHQLNESLEQKVSERTQLAETRAKQLQTLAVELVETEERERRQFAHLLHDDLQQMIASAKMQLQVVSDKFPDETMLKNVGHILEESLKKTRRLSHELSPAVLHHSGLIAGLTWLAQKMNEQFGLQTFVKQNTDIRLENTPLKVFLFRAVQELLFNVVKHAGVDRARMDIDGGDGLFTITVSDQGRGFDQDNLDKAADQAGFGLLTIRERAQYIGGRLEIDSGPGKGSRFTLSIPVLDNDAEELHWGNPAVTEKTDQVEPSAVPVDTGKTRVFFVDDHEVMRQGLIQLIANQPDIEVVGEASNGRDAVEHALRLRPEVIVMDVTMPDMDGIEATRIIKAKIPDIRVIGLSMHMDETISRAMVDAGADSFLSKTASPAELLKTIYGVKRGNIAN